MATRGRRLRALAALGIGLLGSLALAELWLRALRPASLSRIEYPCVYEPDPELGFRYVPHARGRVSGHFEIDNEVELNSLGFYDEEPLPPGQGDLRVLAVGDSFTASMNVPRSEVWTAVAERWLRAHGHPRADVINLGLDGTGTDVHVGILRRFVPRLEPQLVVLAFFGNDFGDVQNGRFTRECHRGFVLSYQTEAQRAGLRARADEVVDAELRRWLWSRLYLARLVARLWGGPLSPWRLNFLQPRRSELGLDDAVIESRRPWVAAALDALESVARSCDCILMVAPVPPRAAPAGSLRLLRAEAGARELRVVDVLPAIRAALARDGLAPDALYFVHDDHLNAYGNRLYGEAVAAAIDRALRSRPPGRQTGATTPDRARAPAPAGSEIELESGPPDRLREEPMAAVARQAADLVVRSASIVDGTGRPGSSAGAPRRRAPVPSSRRVTGDRPSARTTQ